MESIILTELREIKSLIQNKSNKKYLTMRELESYCSLSQSTIRRAIQGGRLKVSRRKGKLLFSTDNIESWLSNG